MSLGRFAAYFLLLMTVGLVAFPRTVASAPASAGLAPLSACAEDVDGSITCAAPAWRPRSLRHSPHVPRHRPSFLPRLEAGPAGLPMGILSDVGRAHRPLDA